MKRNEKPEIDNMGTEEASQATKLSRKWKIEKEEVKLLNKN